LVLCLVCVGKSFGYQEDKSNCDTDSLTMPRPGCTLSEEYCEVTESALDWTANGVEAWVWSKSLCENCTSACGTGENLPQPITCTKNLSVSFTDLVSHSVMGGIEGGSFIAGIKAKLEVAVGGQNSLTVTCQDTLSVTLPSCTWQRIYIKMKTVKGKIVAINVQMQPTRIWSCPGAPHVDQTGMTVNGSVTCNADVGVAGSGVMGTDASGSCPPAPPLE